MKKSILQSLLILTTLVIPIQGKLLAGNKQVDPTVTISAGQIIEADESNVLLEFTITLSAKPTRAVIVRYDTTSITAIEGIDFLKTSGQEVFKPSKKDSITRTIQIPVIGDYEPEGDESFDIVTTRIINGVEDTPNFFKALIIDNDLTIVSKADQIKNLRQIVYTEGERRNPSYAWRTPITGLDLDADGDEDIVVVYAKSYNNQTGELVIYRNDNTTESGWIAEPTGIMTNTTRGSMLVSDFNGDGLDDLFLGNPYYTDNHVSLLQVDGSLVQGAVVEQMLGAYGSKGYQSNTVRHSAGDLDNDGDIDIFMVSQSDPYGHYYRGHITWINDGQGNFTPEYRTDYKFRNIRNQWAYSSAIADFNGDGINEIFIGTNGYEFNSTRRAGHYNHLFGNNNMLMAATGEITNNAVPRVTNDVCDACSNFATTIDVKAIDINGDGWMDVITQNYDNNVKGTNARVDVYLGNNNGTFDLSQSLKSGTAMDSFISLEDVDGDSDLDIVSTAGTQLQTYFAQKVGWSLNRTESVVYINDGGGYFAEDASVTIDKVSVLSGMFFMTQDLDYIPTELQQ